MVEISTLEFALLVQALFIVCVLLLAWMARLRRTRAQLAQLRLQPTVAGYCREHSERMRAALAEDTLDADSRRSANLRLAYLERECATLDAADLSPNWWRDLHLSLCVHCVQAHDSATEVEPSSPASDQADSEDADMAQILNQQLTAIAQLEHILAENSDAAAIKNVLGEPIEQLRLSTRELKFCTDMMEEENDFLRGQIRTLISGQ